MQEDRTLPIQISVGDLMKDDNKTKKQLIHELTELKKSITGDISTELAVEEALRYAESIVETVREPLLVLDADLKIISANPNFYRTFKVTPGETIGNFIYDLGNKQWDIPELRELLEEILPEKEVFDDFEVAHNFQDIGQKTMLLNARQIYRKDIGAKMILLAIEDITEHKRLEDLLKEAEGRYRHVFETASDGIVLFEKCEGKITHANQAVEKMLSYSLEECVGKKLQDIGIVDIDDFPTLMKILNEIGITHYTNVPIKTKSGKHIDTDIYLADRAKLVQCNIRDIAPRKLAEYELSESEKRYRALFNAIDEGFCIIEVIFDENEKPIDYRFLEINPSFEKQTGLIGAQGKRMRELAPKHEEHWFEIYGKIAVTGQPARFVNRAEQLHRWYDVYAFRLDQPENRQVAILFNDITKNRLAEEDLLRTNTLLTSIVENIPNMIFLKDAKELRFVRFNRAGEALLGYSRDDLLGKNDYDFFSKEQADFFTEKDREVMHGKEVVDIPEEPIQTRNKGERTLHTKKVPILNAEGRPEYLLGISEDITERKKVEQQVKERMKELQTFYSLAEISGREGITLDKLYQEFTNILPQSWRYPEIACARIVIGDNEFRTKNFVDSAWMQSAPINVDRSVVGRIEVGYLEERPEEKEGPFLKEERQLIDGLAERLGRITEHKQAEAALRESEEKFRNYIERAPDGVFILDDTGRYLEANKSACQLVGYFREEIEKISIHDLLAEESLEDGLAHFNKLMETGAAVSDLWHKHKHGSKPCLTVNAVKLSETRILGFCKDITERKKAEENLKETLESLRKAVGATIQVMVSAIEVRDPYTAGHQIRSTDIARAIATEMGLPQEKIEAIRMAGPIHDIGKLAVPAEILSKPTKLTNIEFSLIKEHSQKGYEMLMDVESPWPLAEIIYQHHERMDGSGYPRNLKGDEILMEARILAVADVVEAMASHRPYRAGLGIDAALEEIEKNRGTFYDNAVADACLRLFREKGFKLEEHRF
jgi:PAS domain S-box-containing protein